MAQSVAINTVAFEPQVAAGCAATSVKANALVVGNTFAHECFGQGDGGLREVSAGTPVELLGVAAFQPPADQAAKTGGRPLLQGANLGRPGGMAAGQRRQRRPGHISAGVGRLRGMRQARMGAGAAHPRCPDAGAGRGLTCAELHAQLRRVLGWIVVQLLQGLHDGEGLRQQLHQPQLYMSQGTGVRLQWVIQLCWFYRPMCY